MTGTHDVAAQGAGPEGVAAESAGAENRAAERVAAKGEKTLVMYGEGAAQAARRMLPKLPDICFVPAGRDALRGAVDHGLAQIVLVGGADDVAELVGGAESGSVGEVLAAITTDMDGGPALAAAVAAAGTARRAYGLWQSAGMLGPCGRELCRRAAGELEQDAAEAAGSAASPLAAQVVLIDESGDRMVGMYGRMAR